MSQRTAGVSLLQVLSAPFLVNVQRRQIFHNSKLVTAPAFPVAAALQAEVQQTKSSAMRKVDECVLEGLGLRQTAIDWPTDRGILDLRVYVMGISNTIYSGPGSPSSAVEAVKAVRPSAVFLGLGIIDYFDVCKQFDIRGLTAAGQIEPVYKSARKRYGWYIPLLQHCLIRKIPLIPIGRDQGAMLTSCADVALKNPGEVFGLYKLLMTGGEAEFGTGFTLQMLRQDAPRYWESAVAEDARFILYSLHQKLFEFLFPARSAGSAGSATSSDRQRASEEEGPHSVAIQRMLKAFRRAGLADDDLDRIEWDFSRGTGNPNYRLPKELKQKRLSLIDLKREELAVAAEELSNIMPLRIPLGKPTDVLLVCSTAVAGEVVNGLETRFSGLQRFQGPLETELRALRRVRNWKIFIAWCLYIATPFAGILSLLFMGFKGWNLYFTQGRQVSVGGTELLEKWEKERTRRQAGGADANQSEADQSAAVDNGRHVNPDAAEPKIPDAVVQEQDSSRDETEANTSPVYTRVSDSFFDPKTFYRNDKRD